MTTSHVLLIAMVAAASVTDLRAHRIPNVLCLGGLIAGVGLQVAGGAPFWAILASVLVPFCILLPFYALGGMAAGDVKLMAACGALVGWPLALLACGYTLVTGAVLGAGVYLVRGGWSSVVDRYSLTARALIATGHFFLEPAPDGSIAASRFPYAVAIALGSVGAVYFPVFVRAA